MKKLALGILSMILVLSFLGITGCGGGGDNAGSSEGGSSTAAAVSSTSAAASTAAAQSSSSGLTWDDMPVYSGAQQIQKGNWSVPQSEDQDYSKMEWRYYEVKAAAADVAAYYKEKMASFGWTESGWMEVQDNSWGWYTKNDEADAAMVYVMTGEEGLNLALWRASGKTVSSDESDYTDEEEYYEEPEETTAAAKLPPGNLTWDDMPIYAGAQQTEKANFSGSQEDDQDYSKFEWRYFDVQGDIEAVSAFYKEQMPAKGWTETTWMEIEGNTWGYYTKNDEADAAMVNITAMNEGIMLGLWRAAR